MPVFLNPKYPDLEGQSGLDWPRVQTRALEERSTFLHIGLVNNMADAAMCATEHQFLRLLDAASGDKLVHLTLYALPEVERKSSGQRRVDSFYFGIEQLWEQPPEQRPDGLIVTGREPLTPDLREEAYWPSFKRVLAWTQEHARSAVWSCLAAHAAVLMLDGIERVRSQHKHFGIFTCEQVEPHALLDGAPASLRFPHSRWNGVSGGQLAANGYQVLTRTSDGGVDTFVKQDAGAVRVLPGPSRVRVRDTYARVPARRRAVSEGRDRTTRCCRWTTSRKRPSGRCERLKPRHVHRARRSSSTKSPPCSTASESTTLGASTAVLMYRNWLEHLCTQKRHSGKLMLGVGVHKTPLKGVESHQGPRKYRAILTDAAQIPAP